MSCQHGNWGGQCEICDEIDAAWKAGEASGKRSAEHCTCPACRITHASDCAVHNMPAMPVGPCDCGAARSGVAADVVSRKSALEAITHVERHNGPGRANQARAMLESAIHPARSGVVSDEDVDAACFAAINLNAVTMTRHTRASYAEQMDFRKAMRAALEHFAKGERHER